MAGTVNKAIIIGRLGADPDMRYSPDGSAVAKFNVATDEPEKQSDGTWKERPEWHRVVAFGKTAENCGTYLTKGKQVYVEGRLRTNAWEDSQGVKRYTTEIVAREVKFLGGKSDGDGQGKSQGQSAGAGGTKSQGDGQRKEGYSPDEDIPF